MLQVDTFTHSQHDSTICYAAELSNARSFMVQNWAAQSSIVSPSIKCWGLLLPCALMAVLWVCKQPQATNCTTAMLMCCGSWLMQP
jgi:hypothetical protein